jgi:outer membrane receptor for ferrienterochelin and colicins
MCVCDSNKHPAQKNGENRQSKLKRLAWWLGVSSLFPLSMAVAQESSIAQESEAPPVEEIVVGGVRLRLEQAGKLKNVVERTEMIGSTSIASTRSVSLTEAMQLSPGVIVANECSMCGYKRIQLNGLKAEHTNIVIDGLPVHTILSGFYAVDAIATTGVERIEVARGAGASLTSPEAIGGVVNVITTDRYENSFSMDLSRGEVGFGQAGLLGTLVNEDASLRLALIGQYDERDQYDADDNGVSENPFLKNHQTTARLAWDFSERDNLSVRVSGARQTMFGGPMLGATVANIDAALASETLGEAPQLFVGNDVRNRYIGNPWQTTEYVVTERLESSASWLHEMSENWNFTLSGSSASHDQTSFYEGFDYDADDKMNYVDMRFNFAATENHLLSFGTDYRDEKMRSFSEAGFATNNDDDPATVYVSDSFDYQLQGIYLQDSWNATDNLEIKGALRFDQVTADFTDPSKPGVEIDEQIVSPRLDARYFHNDEWTSRFSLGRGFRAPLSFFETDHGILDSTLGFEVATNTLERSVSASYALSYEGDALTSTFSMTRTNVDNLSALSETAGGVPLLTQLSDTASVDAFDMSVGWQVTDNLLTNLTLSKYLHNDVFKSSYGVATMEEQLNLTFDWDVNDWDFYTSFSWVGSRNLRDYGYEGFNDPSATIAKTKDAPAFYTVDMRVAKELRPGIFLYVGGNNVLNSTQARDEDSPLMFDAAGSYNVAYIYGPLRGRELYAGVQINY